MNNLRFFAYRSFNPELETVGKFAKFGCDTVCIFPSNTVNSFGMPYSVYGPTWTGPGKYDFGPFDIQMNDLLAVKRNIRVICMIDLNTPLWWVHQHTSGANRHDSFSCLGKAAFDEKWRDDAKVYLQAFLRNAKKKYRDNIFAYVLAAGACGEWIDYSLGEESIARRQAFRSWALAQGLADPVDIPPASVREKSTHGLLRDPQQDQMAVAYWRFCNWQIGETILFFARAAREVVGQRAALGVYYGYFLTLGHRRLVSNGHLDYERLSRSPEIDFFIAPAVYIRREMGAPSAFMSPVASFQHYGKEFVQELDHRTHTSRSPDGGYAAFFNIWKNETETIAGLRREFAYCLIEGTSFWWFDMWGGFYEDERILKALGEMKSIWDKWKDKGCESAAEIAVIVDPESALFMNQNDKRVDKFIREFLMTLGQIGAPYKVFCFGDLPTLDLAPYKLMIFPNLFIVDTGRENLLRERVMKGGRSLLWLYQPGVIRNGGHDPANVKLLTGIEAESAGIQRTTFKDWTSILSPNPELTSAELRSTAKKAGVHVYSEEGGNVIYASRRLLACHAAQGGKQKFILPHKCGEARELFSGRIIQVHGKEFDDTLVSPDTVLYELID